MWARISRGCQLWCRVSAPDRHSFTCETLVPKIEGATAELQQKWCGRASQQRQHASKGPIKASCSRHPIMRPIWGLAIMLSFLDSSAEPWCVSCLTGYHTASTHSVAVCSRDTEGVKVKPAVKPNTTHPEWRPSRGQLRHVHIFATAAENSTLMIYFGHYLFVWSPSKMMGCQVTSGWEETTGGRQGFIYHTNAIRHYVQAPLTRRKDGRAAPIS